MTQTVAYTPPETRERTALSQKVLIVHNSADLYGASRSLLRLSAAMLERDSAPHVVLPESGPLADRLREMGVAVTILDDLRVVTRQIYASPLATLRFFVGLPKSVWRLRKLIKQLGVDIVHTNTGVVVTPALAAAAARVPHVWHIRDWFQEFRRIWPIYDWFVRSFSTRVVCVSTAIARQFTPSSHIVVINNGFPKQEFDIDVVDQRRRFREQWGIGESEVVIGTVGRIKFVRKGQENLVEAAALLRSNGLRARFLIVGKAAPGNEDHEARLRALVAKHELEDWFVFVGELEDPRPAYAAMDVFVLPSAQPEPFGGVVIEAMALGLPVIATNLGGSPDQVDDGATGLLVPPADPQAIANRISHLLRDEDLRHRMGSAGRDRFETHFTIERMLQQLLAVYSAAAVQRPVG